MSSLIDTRLHLPFGHPKSSGQHTFFYQVLLLWNNYPALFNTLLPSRHCNLPSTIFSPVDPVCNVCMHVGVWLRVIIVCMCVCVCWKQWEMCWMKCIEVCVCVCVCVCVGGWVGACMRVCVCTLLLLSIPCIWAVFSSVFYWVVDVLLLTVLNVFM